jgi:hypothetical protein
MSDEKTMKVLGRDRKGNPVLKGGRRKFFYRGKQDDGRHLFCSNGYHLPEDRFNEGFRINEAYFPDEVFEQFKRDMDGAQLTREEKRKTQASARNKITSFKHGLRVYLKTLRKQHPGTFQTDDYGSPFRKLRLEIFEQNKMRVALTRKNESQPALAFTMRLADISKEDAARYTVAILRRSIVDPKSFDDCEILDLDSPENSAALRKVALKGMIIFVSSSLVGVDNG